MGKRLPRPRAHVPALPEDPCPWRELLGALAHALDRLILRARGAQVHIQARLRVLQQVRVRVDESGQHGAPTQVEGITERPGQRGNLGGVANREDAARAAVDGERLGAGLVGVHGVENTVEQQQQRAAPEHHRVLESRQPRRCAAASARQANDQTRQGVNPGARNDIQR